MHFASSLEVTCNHTARQAGLRISLQVVVLFAKDDNRKKGPRWLLMSENAFSI